MPFFVVAAALAVGAQVVKGAAAKKKRKGVRLQQEITKISNLQQRRAFLNRFRRAQAEAVVSGIASGAGLESSAVQGALASQRTQRNVALGENLEQERLGARAGRQFNRAERLSGFGDLLNVGASLAAGVPNAPSGGSSGGSINPPPEITGP